MVSVEGGYTYFIPITAAYARSCFGMSLEELVHTHAPVRSTKLPARATRQEVSEDNAQAAEARMLTEMQRTFAGVQPLSIPKELWRLVDALWTGGAMKERDLFAAMADADEVDRWMDDIALHTRHDMDYAAVLCLGHNDS